MIETINKAPDPNFQDHITRVILIANGGWPDRFYGDITYMLRTEKLLFSEFYSIGCMLIGGWEKHQKHLKKRESHIFVNMPNTISLEYTDQFFSSENSRFDIGRSVLWSWRKVYIVQLSICVSLTQWHEDNVFTGQLCLYWTS